MVPLKFTQKLGGDYLRWNHGSVEPAILSRWSIDQDFVYIYGIVVYSLYFETDQGPRRWNCKFGWEEKGML